MDIVILRHQNIGKICVVYFFVTFIPMSQSMIDIKRYYLFCLLSLLYAYSSLPISLRSRAVTQPGMILPSTVTHIPCTHHPQVLGEHRVRVL